MAGLPDGRSAFLAPKFAPATALAAGGDPSAMLRLVYGRGTVAAARALVAARDADLVVVDCLLLAPLAGALASGVPTAVLFHTFGGWWVRDFVRGPIGRIGGMRGLAPARLWDAAAARLVLTDRELDPGRDDPRLAGATWTGTTELGAEPGPRGPRPRVLVALSSTTWPGMLPVYRRIVAALAALDIDAVVTTGGVDLGGELAGAPNVEVRGWTPHAELLTGVDLVIGHGGHSTTLKALAHGVPLLILPINPTADQRWIGGLLERAGLGRRLPKSASAATIRRAVLALLADPVTADRTAATGRRLRAQRSGAEVAADALLGFLGV